LAKDVKLLLLDEPTGSVGSINRTIIWELLAHLQESGMTVIVVTHDKTFLAQADKGYKLAEGVLTEIDKTS